MGDKGKFRHTPRTTQYYDEIRILAKEEGLRDAPSIAKAADLVREGIEVEEAVEEARKDYAARAHARRSEKLARPPEEIWRYLVENLPDPSELDKKIIQQYPKLVKKLLEQGLLTCPDCGGSHLIWECSGRRADEN